MSRKPLVLVALIGLAVVIVLFATNFWSADVEPGALPDVDISAQGGSLPAVDLDSKEVVVGTTQANVSVPDVDLETEQVAVPDVSVRADGEE